MKSPFSVTKKAIGDGFVGREDKLEEYRKKLFVSKHGSISVCGLPRVGKSSLVYNLLHGEEKTAEKKIIFADLDNFGRCQSFYHMWRLIVRKLRIQLEDIVLSGNEIAQALQRVEDVGDDFEKIEWALEDLFRSLSRQGIHTIIYLDEFDYVSKVFHRTEDEDASCYFQQLRGLLTDPDYKISFIIVSRRSLSFLETRCQGGSAFHLTFDNQQLVGFNKNEMHQFRDRIAQYGVHLTDEEWKRLIEYTGCSPYLMSMAANDLVVLQEQSSFQDILDACVPRFDVYFRELVSLLEDENYMQRMIQIFVGPKYDVSAAHVRELESRGYITTDGTQLRTISPAFEQYLKDLVFLTGNNKVWPLLNDAERYLRTIIKSRMTDKFGSEWESKIEAEYQARVALDPKRYRYFVHFGKARKFIADTKRKYGSTIQIDLLNVISIGELAQILKHYWADFRSVFGGDAYSDWEPKFSMLGLARAPLAHANPQYLTPAQVEETNAYCKMILALDID